MSDKVLPKAPGAKWWFAVVLGVPSNQTMNLPVDVVTVRACARPAPTPPAGYGHRWRSMNAREIELKWMGRVKKVGSLLLLRADDAVRLLDDCVNSQVRFLGVEAFRLFDNGGVQPAMEFSNISFGKIPMQPGDPEFQFKRGLREPWNTDADAIERSKALITAGATSGYDWYEVSLEDPATGNLLFFREPN